MLAQVLDCFHGKVLSNSLLKVRARREVPHHGRQNRGHQDGIRNIMILFPFIRRQPASEDRCEEGRGERNEKEQEAHVKARHRDSAEKQRQIGHLPGGAENALCNEEREHDRKEQLPSRNVEGHGQPFQDIPYIDGKRGRHGERVCGEARAVRRERNYGKTKKKNKFKTDTFGWAPALCLDSPKVKFHKPTCPKKKNQAQSNHPGAVRVYPDKEK